VRRILGLDLGDARIGVAISDELGMLAHPLETVDARAQPMERIAEIVVREKVETLVVGLPRNMNGTYGPAAEKVREFTQKLIEKTGCAIRFVDERMTTVAAQKALHLGGRNTKQSRGVIDQVAAQMILQMHLDAQAGGLAGENAPL
jgi:putative Holliday junction resolvase